ncbi:MAG: glycoside hydrolase family 32 protein [Oscillospiraceae bacterium]|nr:glycoside hydrolase family 32 protein [Oscillospiraceae bacterium]
MISEKLQKARDYVAEQGAHIPPENYPLFHVTPVVGWLNDPNGFSVYKGEYHIFYQYHPYGLQWGPMHWGHSKSRDFVRWERLPVSLAPDEDYDHNGCFSGSAAELPDGRHLLMYTAGKIISQEDGTPKKLQIQCLAIGDGVDYEKFSGNPVMDGSVLPPEGIDLDFRDPKIWLEGDIWYAVIVNRIRDETAGCNTGAVLLYSSANLEDWELAGQLDCSHNEYGKMWECPDFFQLDGKQVLLVSPQEMETKDPALHEGHVALCLLGDWDGKTFTRRSVQPVDQGLDFYAPQTLLTPDGRRIMIGWMQSEFTKYVPDGSQWFGMFSLPRELRIQDGRLIQSPVRELENYRKEQTVYQNVRISAPLSLPGICGRTLELNLTVRPVEGETYDNFILKFAQNSRYFTSLTFDPIRNVLVLDRSQSGFPRGIKTPNGYPAGVIHQRTVPLLEERDELRLRVLLDRYSAEIYVNGGEQVLTVTFYTPQTADGIIFDSEGTASLDVEQYRLEI